MLMENEKVNRAYISVVICTRERPEDLERCLRGLKPQQDSYVEVLVVDNAPLTNATREVAQRHGVGYVVEPAKGLDRARNCGILQTKGDIIAFLDDDTFPESDWIATIRRCLEDPKVVGIAGAFLPLELRTEGQNLFEQYHQLMRGKREERREFGPGWPPACGGHVGAGANMAFRREALLDIRGFDGRFDAGTITRSGGDTDIFARFLDAHYTLAYEPSLRIYHRHRRTRKAVRAQLFGYGVGVYAFWTKRVIEHRDMFALRLTITEIFKVLLKRLPLSLTRWHNEMPFDLVMSELIGQFYGPIAYFRARRMQKKPYLQLPKRRRN
jgi:GT2 family glycosyltransferase